jgi:hypothetical protein
MATKAADSATTTAALRAAWTGASSWSRNRIVAATLSITGATNVAGAGWVANPDATVIIKGATNVAGAAWVANPDATITVTSAAALERVLQADVKKREDTAAGGKAKASAMAEKLKGRDATMAREFEDLRSKPEKLHLSNAALMADIGKRRNLGRARAIAVITAELKKLSRE